MVTVMSPTSYFLIVLLGAAMAAAQEPQASEAPPASAGLAEPADAFSEARQLVRQGKYDQALEELNQLAQRNPGLNGLDREIGFACYAKGDYFCAAASFQKVIAHDPTDREATQLLGLSDYLAGRPAQAIPYLEKVQSWFPRANVDAFYILGVCYIQTKDYAKAREAFARMFEVPLDSSASYLFTARMLLRQEFDPVVEEYAQKAAALDPKLPGAHLLLGELYLAKSRVPEAIEQLQKELSLDPANATIYYKLADAYSRVQKFDDAERLLQRSIWLDATSTGPYILMGKVLGKKGEYELAVRALRRAAAMDPNNPMTHQLLATNYRAMGMKEQSENELKAAAELIRRDARP